MFAAPHEWTRPEVSGDLAIDRHLTPTTDASANCQLYHALADSAPCDAVRAEARDYLHAAINHLDRTDCDLPESAQDLMVWMQNSAQLASAKYRAYLEDRAAGGPRRYFSNRAHALYFIRNVAPTKLVDGSWLYGVLAHADNPRFSDLVQTYVEELGDGQADKNHVVLYRQLLNRYGLDPIEDLPDPLYVQGVLQLGLGWNPVDFLPELVGFNLGYEQLPLHLLITAYELNELGIDPYYFTLHITVDNEATGHARRAVQAVHDTLPRLGGADAAEAFWQRIRDGYQLSNAGVGTTEVIEGFDIDAEVVRIFQHKSSAGHGAHSDYCRVAGKSINDWLSDPAQMPSFITALEGAGWIQRGKPATESRFWQLLQGPRAEMFGVFSAYELQVIHDWIRGDASVDGLAYADMGAPEGKRRPTFRATARLAATRHARAIQTTDAKTRRDGADETELLDPDLHALKAQLQSGAGDAAWVRQQLVLAMSPSEHWTPAGMYATRMFLETA